MLTSKEEQDKRWAEHFSEILSKPAPENAPDIALATEDLDISTDAPAKQEIIKAIKALKNNKTTRQDTLQVELLNINPDLAADLLLPLFENIWEQEQVPHDWTCGTIVKISKKGNLSDCNNWRGNTLLSVPCKVFCKVIMMRVVDAVDSTLRKEQAGFQRGRGTTEHIFTLRNILEQCNEWQRKIYVNFLDLEKAFDSVHRDSLWRILRHYGVPQKVTSIISLLSSDYTCCMQNSSLSFAVNSGVRQGCVMSAFLFIMAIDWFMKTVTEQKQTGIRWSLFSVLEDLEFADDITLPSHTWTHMQQKSSRLNDRASTIGLRINADKTKVISSDPRRQPVIVNNKALDYVDKFTYLGSILSLHGGSEEDITSRLGKARSAFFRLQSVWKSTNYSRETKLRLLIKAMFYPYYCMDRNVGERRKVIAADLPPFIPPVSEES